MLLCRQKLPCLVSSLEVEDPINLFYLQSVLVTEDINMALNKVEQKSKVYKAFNLLD